ncbi:MAG TPA: peptidylprolyl isomerase [Sandaracinaceae bacterium LLY-WYZ-13_1]|nr:peptidylprolyl isomerase [Sandaracinaceae bacterium LLY-WYZ-13_1]
MSEETVEAGKVVSIDYVLTSPEGEELDRSEEGAPLVYLHGAHNIVPGLEEALAGKAVGDQVRAEVPPEKGYGVRQKEKPQRVLRSKFPPEADVKKGAQFLMQGPDGKPFPIWIKKVQGREVQVTSQHPLAGVTLRFDVTVREIRDATEEEKEHGHAHGPGGHHHGPDGDE